MGLHKEHRGFSVKSHVENRLVASRGIGAVQLPEGVQFYKFKESGTVRLDVIPYRTSKPQRHPDAVDDVWYEVTYFIHRNVGQNNLTVICPKSTFGKPCPICEYRNTLDRSDEHDLKIIKDLMPKERQLFNVVVLDANTKIESPKIYVLDQPRYEFGRVIDELVKNADEDDEHYQYYVDLKIGSTLKLTINEKNAGDFKYFGVSSIEIKPRKYKYDESVLEHTVDLDATLQITPYDELKNMFHSEGNHAVELPSDSDSDPDSNWNQLQRLKKESELSDDDDDKPLEKPKKKVVTEEEEAAATKKAKPPVVDEDEEPKPKKKVVIDEDDESPAPTTKSKPPFNVDEDEEPKPKKKAPINEDDEEPRPKKKVVIDEDEEPKPKKKAPINEDDEDEPKPKKKVIVDDEDEEPKPKNKVPSKKSALVEDWDDEDD
jgi:hypothetical protein